MRGSSPSLVCAVHISHHLMCHHHAFMLCVWFSTTSLLSSSCCLSSIFSYRPVFLSGHQLLLPRCGGQIPCALPLMRTLAPLPSTTLFTGYEPQRLSHLGNHWTVHPEIHRRKRVPEHTWPWVRWLHHRHGALFTTVHPRRLSVIERGDRCGTVWLTDLSNVRENPRSSLDNEQIRILLERQREQILADCQVEIRKHDFQADYDRRSIQMLSEVTSL